MALNIKDYEVIYNGKLGMGYILPEDVMIENFINPIPVSIGGSEIIQPSTETSLLGYFNIAPALYIGMIGNEMIFYLGNQTDLFGEKNIIYLSLNYQKQEFFQCLHIKEVVILT
jgi:hypothetical protein